MTDPYASYLTRAGELFAAGDFVQAGQIWQAILKRDPSHALAREGLLQVKERLEAMAAPQAAAPVAPISAGQEDPEIARLLEQGCTLYDSGHVEDALKKWERILIKNPDHAMARGYISGARKRLGLTPLAQAAPVPLPAPTPGGVRATIVQPLAMSSASPRETADGLVLALPVAEPPLRTDLLEPAPAPPPVPPEPVPAPASVPETAAGAPGAEPDADRWLREGCTLYDMGQTEEALKAWERILALDPDHVLAREYVKGARRDLGLPLTPADAPTTAPLPPSPQAQAAEPPSVEHLLREAAQLYDMGMVEEAVARWKRVLEASPGHPEAEAYLGMALRTPAHRVAPPPPEPLPSGLPREHLTTPLSVPTVPEPPPPAPEPSGPARPPVAPEILELKLHQADRLLQLQHHEEAAFAFQRILQMDPGNAAAMDGYQRARELQAATQPPQEAAASESSEAKAAPVQPPAALLAQAPARQGLPVPGPLATLANHPLLRNPTVLISAALVLVVGIAGLWYLRSMRRDRALRVAVERERESAMTSRDATVVDLVETAESIKQEASSTLSDDPLCAYYRAQEAVRLSPTDPGAASLLERARTALPVPEANPALLKDYQQHLQSGDLDSAERALRDLLRGTPEDFGLKNRMGNLCLAMAPILAAKERWDDARTRLRLGRAMFPHDKAWQARLQLLERISSVPKQERARWIALLG